MTIGNRTKILQGLQDNLEAADIIGWSKFVDKFIILKNENDADPSIPLLGYFNLGRKFFTNWLASNNPCIVMNRPYIGGWANQYKLNARRFSINAYACTKWGHRTHARYHLLNLPKNPWKVQKIRHILLAPPGKLTWFWHQQTAEDWVVQIENFFQDKKVKIRRRMKYDNGKNKKGIRYSTLWTDLDWADLVISYGSAVCAEAFWFGKKAINLGPCPTWVCCDRTLNNWEDPTEPEGRDEWHEHMAWTQFTEQERLSGLAQEQIIQYQGWPI